MAHIKRNKAVYQIDELLARLVAFSNDQRTDAAAISDGRAVLVALLEAPFGDFVVGKHARGEIRSWNAERIRTRREGLFHFFRIFKFPVFDVEIEHLWVRPVVDHHNVAIQIDGPAADVLTLRELSLLRAVGIGRVKTCECGTVFARVGRQEFCSERCQKRVYMRLIRAEEGRRRGRTTRKK